MLGKRIRFIQDLLTVMYAFFTNVTRYQVISLTQAVFGLRRVKHGFMKETLPSNYNTAMNN
jgi:hypothetical protein